MAETPWWAALGAAAVLGTGTAFIASSVPVRRSRVVGSRGYRIKGHRKTEVVANFRKAGDEYDVEWDFPYGLRSESGALFEVDPDLYPRDIHGFRSLEHAQGYADIEMARLPWFSRHG